jgi:hypothetical protein
MGLFLVLLAAAFIGTVPLLLALLLRPPYED